MCSVQPASSRKLVKAVDVGIAFCFVSSYYYETPCIALTEVFWLSKTHFCHANSNMASSGLRENVILNQTILSKKVPKCVKEKRDMVWKGVYNHGKSSGHGISVDNISIVGREEHSTARIIKKAMFHQGQWCIPQQEPRKVPAAYIRDEVLQDTHAFHFK